jgi:hypothetical protein
MRAAAIARLMHAKSAAGFSMARLKFPSLPDVK